MSIPYCQTEAGKRHNKRTERYVQQIVLQLNELEGRSYVPVISSYGLDQCDGILYEDFIPVGVFEIKTRRQTFEKIGEIGANIYYNTGLKKGTAPKETILISMSKLATGHGRAKRYKGFFYTFFVDSEGKVLIYKYSDKDGNRLLPEENITYDYAFTQVDCNNNQKKRLSLCGFLPYRFATHNIIIQLEEKIAV
jgi:hypothetical protein